MNLLEYGGVGIRTLRANGTLMNMRRLLASWLDAMGCRLVILGNSLRNVDELDGVMQKRCPICKRGLEPYGDGWVCVDLELPHDEYFWTEGELNGRH